MNLIHFRVKIVLFFLILSFLVLEARLYWIQVHQSCWLKDYSESQTQENFSPCMRRGEILDRNSIPLAVSLECGSVYCFPPKVKKPESAAELLARILDEDSRLLKKKLTSSADFVWIKRKVPNKVIEKIKKLKLHGIGWQRDENRFYLEGNLASCLIGFVGIENQGLSGVEYRFNQYLKGKKEDILISQDGMGRELIFPGKQLPVATEGNCIWLSIDRSIQFIVQKELGAALRKHQAKQAMAIVQDVRKGDILAMVYLSNYSDSDFLDKEFNPRWIHSVIPRGKFLNNPMIGSIFEPGSTFKVVLAAATLEERLVNNEEKIFCEEGYWLSSGAPIRDHEKFSWLTFDQIIENSSNIGCAKLAERLGKKLMYIYARNFGFGNPTGILLSGESRGILNRPREWSGSSLSRISFGQAVGVTAIQLISAFSCIANKGVLMEPKVILKIADVGGKIIKQFSSTKVRQVISPETANRLALILERVIEKGTGTLAKVPGYRAAGKTGTAQKPDPKLGGYLPDAYIASFVGFVPLPSPEIAILVLIDEPLDSDSGGKCAAPVFSKIASRLMYYLNIPASPSLLSKEVQALQGIEGGVQEN